MTPEQILQALRQGSITLREAHSRLRQHFEGTGRTVANAWAESNNFLAGSDLGLSREDLPQFQDSTGGTGNGQQGAIQNVGQVLPEELFGGIPAFTRGLREAGLPTGIGGGAFGQFLRGRFDPTAATFLAQTALGGQPPTDLAAPFASFAGQTAGGGLGQQAGGAFQNLLNLSRGGGDILGQNPLAQRFLAPTEGADFTLAANLAREASRGQIGGFAANQLLPRSNQLVEQFLGGPQSANAAAFLPFLQRSLGL